MSYAYLFASVAAQAQGILAEMQGMVPGGTNVLLPNDVACVGVYDYPQVVEEPVIGGGYRKRTEVRVSITRDQPSLEGVDMDSLKRLKLVRTDLPTPITYTIDKVDNQQPHVFLLTLVSFLG